MSVSALPFSFLLSYVCQKRSFAVTCSFVLLVSTSHYFPLLPQLLHASFLIRLALLSFVAGAAPVAAAAAVVVFILVVSVESLHSHRWNSQVRLLFPSSRP